MTYKVLFLGSRMDCIIQRGGSITETTFGIDTNFCDAGFTTNYGEAQGILTDPAQAPLMVPYAVQAGATLYFHAAFAWGDGYIAYYPYVMLALLDSAGNAWINLYETGQMQYNAGTVSQPAWTNLGNAYSIPGGYSSSTPIDIKIDIAANGVHTLMYANNGVAILGPINFTQPLMTNIASFVLNGSAYGGGSRGGPDSWSQIMCTENLSTIGAHVKTCRPTGVGAHSDWEGTNTDVNDQITNDATSNSSTLAGNQQSYPMDTITVPTGYRIPSVVHNIRAENDLGDSPHNIASLVRTSAGVDHVSGNLNGLTTSFTGIGAKYDVNPDTGQPWTQADWNAPVQFGFVSE